MNIKWVFSLPALVAGVADHFWLRVVSDQLKCRSGSSVNSKSDNPRHHHGGLTF